jgi:uncharacterized protein YgiM (DUF1202 family)
MAIKASDAIRVARSLIGTPYSELDCINLIKKVIRTAPGGAKDYTTAGTNTLWDSYESSGKYRDLTWRQSGIAGAKAGMLAFKTASLNDVSHVGIVTSDGTVIHSSSTYGGRGVVETPLTASEGWTLLGIHKHIETAENAAERQETTVASYKAQVVLSDENSTLNVRNEPGKAGDRIGRLGHGAIVTVQAEFDNGWKFVLYGDNGSGYVDGSFLQAYEEPETEAIKESTVTLIDSTGRAWSPVGDFKVLFGAVD